MKDIEFSFEHAMTPQPAIRNLVNAISVGYEGDLASLYPPDDRLMLGKVRQVIGKNLQLKTKDQGN